MKKENDLIRMESGRLRIGEKRLHVRDGFEFERTWRIELECTDFVRVVNPIVFDAPRENRDVSADDVGDVRFMGALVATEALVHLLRDRAIAKELDELSHSKRVNDPDVLQALFRDEIIDE